MAPAGYSGVNIWGSTPVVDTARNIVYVSTGDNYSHPSPDAPSAISGESFSQCMADTTHGGSEPNCLAPELCAEFSVISGSRVTSAPCRFRPFSC